jgi:hypothetical protein
MPPEGFECVDVILGPEALPLQSQQGSATGPGVMHLALLASLAAAVVVPQFGLAGYALQSPEIRQMILDQPLVTFQLAITMAFWICLFAWPLKGLVTHLTTRRSVEITSDRVSVIEARAFGTSTWSAPLSSYKGVAHHIRSSLSGTRHELVLVHPEAKKSVLLVAANEISTAEIGRMAELLRLPQVPPSVLYGRHRGTISTPKTLSWLPVPA